MSKEKKVLKNIYAAISASADVTHYLNTSIPITFVENLAIPPGELYILGAGSVIKCKNLTIGAGVDLHGPNSLTEVMI